MMAKAKAGTVVKADFGNGEEWALLVETAGDKDVLVPLGKGQLMAYREPGDRDEQGAGRTWWNA